MARPQKLGMDYFPFDVDFFIDEKISAVEGEFGSLGVLAVIKLLCLIYRNGYFIRWSDVVLFGLLRQIPELKEDELNHIIERLVEWGFFDKGLFDSERILTSHGIQSRFFEVYKNRVRKRQSGAGELKHWLNTARTGGGGVVMACHNSAETSDELNNELQDDNKVDKIRLLDANFSDKNPSLADSGVVSACHNSAETPQSKVNKSKVNKTTAVVAELIVPRAREEMTATAADERTIIDPINDQTDVETTDEKGLSDESPSNSREGAPIFESWRYSETEYSPEFLALLDEIAAKFNQLDGRMYARQLESLLREVHRPGVVDGITVVRDGLKKLNTAEAIKKKLVTMSPTRFLRYDIFIKLINGDYDTVYRKKRGRAEPEDQTSFDDLQKQGYYN